MLTAERLRELVIYSPGNGEFHWLVGKGARAAAGARAGTINARGYEVFCIDRKLYLAHRLAWLYMYGEWPKPIDHIDANPANNRWSNLREATQSLNVVRGRTTKERSRGRKGTWFDPKLNKWQAYISKDGRRRHLGVFSQYDEAVLARRAAEMALYGEKSL